MRLGRKYGDVNYVMNGWSINKMSEKQRLSDVIKKKLTKVENFLINAKVDPNDWDLAESEVKSEKQEVYMMAPGHYISFSENGIPSKKEGYLEVRIDLNLLRKVLLFFNRNTKTKEDSISLFLKNDHPLQIYNDEIWGSIAPITEEENQEDDE